MGLNLINTDYLYDDKNYHFTCDLVHNLIVKSKLYTILASVSESNIENINSNETKESYQNLAVSALKTCEALGRDVGCPGILLLTGLNMINYQIDSEYGKELIAESFDLSEINKDLTDENDELNCIPIVRDARLLISTLK
jgi:hypothetical protein